MAFLFNWAEVEPDEYAMTTTASFHNFVHYPLMVNWYGDLHAPHEAVTAAIDQMRGKVPVVGDVTYE